MKKQTLSTQRWFVIANPVAGGGRVRRQWNKLRPWLRDELPHAEFASTLAPGHATALAKLAIGTGCRHILAIGGDGTAHEVANAILEQQTVDSLAITLALLPIGTGNDWIRSYGIPRKRKAWLAMLREGNCIIQDAGRLEYFDTAGIPRSRYFLNVVGIGFDAYVVKRLRERPLPAWIRQAYLLSILKHLLNYRTSPARVRLDQEQWQDHLLTLEAGFGRYVGGGLQLLPHARPAEGRLAVTLAGRTGKLNILANIRRFFDGSIGRHPNVTLYKVSELRAEAAGPVPLLVEADGEYLGQTPVRIQIIPQALKVLAS